MGSNVGSDHIITANGRRIDLEIVHPEVKAHFTNPNTDTGYIAHEINEARVYDFALKGRQDYVMLDIGANVGMVSIYASDACKRIVALEPAPAHFSVLSHLTWQYKNIERLEYALMGHTGATEFHLNDVNTCASSAANTYGATTTVKCTSLIDLLESQKLYHVDFAKIDIEGSETEALTPRQVGECSKVIMSYYVEVHNCPNSTWEWKLGKLVETFSHAGYSYQRIRKQALYAAQPPTK